MGGFWYFVCMEEPVYDNYVVASQTDTDILMCFICIYIHTHTHCSAGPWPETPHPSPVSGGVKDCPSMAT